ncbi:unnamed protein product [Paramecium sonneborni]|uniref:Uncharacterized protein n=1 Tax=Paramecium sonneborni TaxID=65129 RepID=A0A8S1PFV6_9CILI|nr:unnamed protein product [Paramecium sonneborni]
MVRYDKQAKQVFTRALLKIYGNQIFGALVFVEGRKHKYKQLNGFGFVIEILQSHKMLQQIKIITFQRFMILVQQKDCKKGEPNVSYILFYRYYRAPEYSITIDIVVYRFCNS